MHVLPSWDALKLKVALPSGKRLRRHLSNSSCASTESSSSRTRELSESECSSDSETPRKAKSVSFKERVGVILIPSKEELDARSIWWSARELQGIRKAFYAHVNHLMQQQQQQQQQRDFKLDLPRLLAASQLSSIDGPIRIPEAKFTSARSPEVAQRAAAIRVKVR